MLARRTEADVWLAFFHQAGVDANRRQVGEMPVAVHGKVLEGLIPELLEFLLVVTLDSVCRPDIGHPAGALDLVFLLQTAGDHAGPQYAHRIGDDVVVVLEEEHLGRIFLGQFLQVLAQLPGL